MMEHSDRQDEVRSAEPTDDAEPRAQVASDAGFGSGTSPSSRRQNKSCRPLRICRLLWLHALYMESVLRDASSRDATGRGGEGQTHDAIPPAVYSEAGGIDHDNSLSQAGQAITVQTGETTIVPSLAVATRDHASDGGYADRLSGSWVAGPSTPPPLRWSYWFRHHRVTHLVAQFLPRDSCSFQHVWRLALQQVVESVKRSLPKVPPPSAESGGSGQATQPVLEGHKQVGLALGIVRTYVYMRPRVGGGQGQQVNIGSSVAVDQIMGHLLYYSRSWAQRRWCYGAGRPSGSDHIDGILTLCTVVRMAVLSAVRTSRPGPVDRTDAGFDWVCCGCAAKHARHGVCPQYSHHCNPCIQSTLPQRLRRIQPSSYPPSHPPYQPGR